MIGADQKSSDELSSQTCPVSRRRTNSVASSTDTANVNAYSSTNSGSSTNHSTRGKTWFPRTKKASATRLTTKVIATEIVAEAGISSRGNESFWISDPWESTD